MEGRSVSFVSTKMFVGVFLVLFGGLLTLDNFDIVDAEAVLRYWSVFLIALGLKFLIDERWFAGIAWTLIGSWILLYNLRYIDWSLWDLWPLLFVIFGFVLVRQSIFPPEESEEAGAKGGEWTNGLAILCSARKKPDTSQLRGGSATAFLGHSIIDLSNADMADNEVNLNVFAFMGGVEVIVPKHWTVSTEVFPVMGGVDDKTSPDQTAEKRLVIRGTACMGGIEVRN